MCRLYANTLPTYIRDLNIHRFWYSAGSPGTNPPRILPILADTFLGQAEDLNNLPVTEQGCSGVRT